VFNGPRRGGRPLRLATLALNPALALRLLFRRSCAATRMLARRQVARSAASARRGFLGRTAAMLCMLALPAVSLATTALARRRWQHLPGNGNRSQPNQHARGEMPGNPHGGQSIVPRSNKTAGANCTSRYRQTEWRTACNPRRITVATKALLTRRVESLRTGLPRQVEHVDPSMPWLSHFGATPTEHSLAWQGNCSPTPPFNRG
jgi:hypothetical protein